jgi:hypothetical protein
VNVVYLSDVLGGAAYPLFGHDGLSVNWEFTLDGFDQAQAYNITMDAVSYITTKTNCNNVLGTELFQLTFGTANLVITGTTSTACYPDAVKFNAAITYPPILNLNTAVKADAKITSNVTLPADTKIKWGYNAPPSTTYSLPLATNIIMLSTIVGGGAPYPLQGHSGTDTWYFEIWNAGTPVDFTLTIQPEAVLNTTLYPYTAGGNQYLDILNCSFGGWVKYNNPATTKMNNVVVELYQGASKVYPLTGEPVVKTDGDGNYTFPKVGTGTYDVHFTTTKPTGSINATDAAQVNQWWTALYSIELVRFFAGDVLFDDEDIAQNIVQAQDAQLIQGNFVQGLPFDRVPWSFWRAGETTSDNDYGVEGYVYPQVTISTGAPSQTGINFYGQATGDFNRSFTPGSLKAGTENLELVYKETIQVNASTLFELPIYTVASVNIGAASVILNFPADLVEVTGVSMNFGGMLDWAVKGDELRIGWNTQNPVSLAAGEQLLTISLRSTAQFTQGNEIRFTLANNILNELADETYEVIPDARLSISVVEASNLGISDPGSMPYALSLSSHPNPFRDYTMITYTIPFEGRVNIDIYNILGEKVTTLVNATKVKGNYTIDYLTGTLQPGVYTVALKLQGESEMMVRTVKIISR